MADKLICFRPTYEQRELLVQAAAQQQITVSEYLRMLIDMALGGGAFAVDEGYIEARKLALKLSHEMIRQAAAMLPGTYDEAVSYFGLAGPGYTRETR